MAKNGNIHPTRIFKKPEELDKAWKEYKTALKEEAKNWPVVTYVGKDGEKKIDYPTLPITMEGFYAWYYNTYGKYIEQYYTNQDKYYKDFIGICRVHKNEARANQITGGMINQFNPSITQRLNSLTEKTETNATLDLSRVPEWMKKKDS